ncbi:MAG: hemolysin family protein, partial [Sutterella wadsworthensis]|nr:hemolysin family protein [Sutterella wadsworthensis]
MISSLPQVVGLFCLVLLSAFFSSAEISLSAASKTRLMALSEDGDRRAAMVLEMREHPGQFFSALQIGLNATALLGGIVGDAAFSPFFQWLLAEILPGQDWGRISFVISFLIATTLFVIFADLLPKRLAIARPEAVAMFVVRPMHCIITLFKPCVFILERLSDACIRSLGVPTKRQEAITSEDILASIGAGTAAGVIAPQEEAVIQNVFEMESSLVPSAMTARESIVYFTLDETEASIRAKIGTVPDNRFLV